MFEPFHDYFSVLIFESLRLFSVFGLVGTGLYIFLTKYLTLTDEAVKMKYALGFVSMIILIIALYSWVFSPPKKEDLINRGKIICTGCQTVWFPDSDQDATWFDMSVDACPMCPISEQDFELLKRKLKDVP